MGNDAAERTEPGTGRRRDKERNQGNIPKSQDLISGVMVTSGVALLALFSGYIMKTLESLLYQTFTHLDPKTISSEDIFLIMMPYAIASANILFPFLLTLMVVAIVVVRMQVGHVFAVDKVKMKFESLAPSKMMEGAKKMLNPVNVRSLVELAKSLLKLIIVAATGFSVLETRKAEMMGLLGVDLSSAFAIFGSILTEMLIKICIAMMILGIFDKKYQDYEYEKSIKMSKQEIKDEMKDTEGDPKIKAKIKAIQMQMARQRMMSAIPKADVVVTNPTHYAVAIQYDKTKAPAPIVVAKGVDFVAFKIREVAQHNNIPIVENKPLAQALYKLVPIDGIIPSDMFVAVAEVLAYVYNKDKK